MCNSNCDWENNRFIKLLANANGTALANGDIDLETFVRRMFGHDGLQSMIIRGFKIPLAEALKDYCHFAYVDPMLIEMYIGKTFESIDFTEVVNVVESGIIRASEVKL